MSYVLLGAALLIFGAPLLWLVTTALKQPEDIYTYPPSWLPIPPYLGNFSEAWHAAPFARYAINSAVVALVGTSIELVIAILCAYGFVYVDFPGKKLLFGVLLGGMMIPGHVVLLPNYLTVANLGWIDTYAGLIVPGLGSVFVTFLLRQHMLTLPREVVEAAEVDGAGLMRRLWTIVVPLSRPIIVTGAIVIVIGKWNDFVWPLVVTNTDDMRTLPVGLAFLRITQGETKWGVIMAGTIFVALPMFAAYLLAQRQIVEGLTKGATTG